MVIANHCIQLEANRIGKRVSISAKVLNDDRTCVYATASMNKAFDKAVICALSVLVNNFIL